MAFASQRGGAVPPARARSPRPGHTVGQPYLWPSETDPNRAHWLRNEVVAFERVLVTLREERDAAVAILQNEEAALAVVTAERDAAGAQLAGRDQEYLELDERRAKLVSELEQLQADCAQLEADKLSLRESTADLESQTSQLQSSHSAAQSRVGRQQATQLQLQQKCVDIQTKLEQMRNNPTVPPEYAAFVAKAEAANKARITALQAELQRLAPHEDSIVKSNKAATAKIAECQLQLDGAKQATIDAEVNLTAHQEKKAALQAELAELQQVYYTLPPKVEEETVDNEVIKVVSKSVVF